MRWKGGWNRALHKKQCEAWELKESKDAENLPVGTAQGHLLHVREHDQVNWRFKHSEHGQLFVSKKSVNI